MPSVTGRKHFAQGITVSRTFRLTPKLDQKLTDKANQLGMSRNFLIAAAVDRLFEDESMPGTFFDQDSM